MLVLTRKRNEAIRIHDNIEIVILGIVGDKVKVGINCPRDIPVHREEIYQAIRQEGSRGMVERMIHRQKDCDK